MKNDRKSVEERRARILARVRKQEEATVEELAAECGVSAMTIRRDLQELSDNGVLVRAHGRALSNERAGREERPDQLVKRCREAISYYASTLVNDGDEIFINGSRTALDLLHYTGEKKLTIRTNNGYAIEEEYPAGVRILLIGGELQQKVMIGEYVMQNLLQMSADKTFLGCAAVYDDGEFRYDIPTEIGINELMISRTRGELYILADHSKLQKRESLINSYGSFRYNCPLTLITDELADKEILQRLAEMEIRILQVPVE